jgi:hypothetical protein
MVYSTPIKKNLWANEIQEYGDIQLFICHLILDLKLFFSDGNSFLNCVTPDNKPVFNSKGAAEYEKLMTKCYSFHNGSYVNAVSDLWPELVKWLSETNDGSAKSMQVKNLFTGKIKYIAEYRSDFPLMSVLYSVDNTDENKKHERVGYGTLTWKVNSLSGSGGQYKFYDNNSKKYLDGILQKHPDDSFDVTILPY